MSQFDETLIGRIALFQGLITRDELQACLRIQCAEAAPRRLGEILVDEGHLTPAQLDGILAIRRKKIRSILRDRCGEERAERRFGMIALERGWVELDELEAAILEKERLARRSLRFRIGEVLVARRALTPGQVRGILAEQGKVIRLCRPCDLAFNVRAGSRELRCPRCGGELEDPAFLETIDVDGVLA